MQDLGESSVELATRFHQSGHSEAAAILLAELMKPACADAGMWTRLGACLGASAGLLVRLPFFENAARAFLRARELGVPSELAPMVDEWLAYLRNEVELDALAPLDESDLDELVEFFAVTPSLFVDALNAIAIEDRVWAVIILGDQANERFLAVLAEAAGGVWGAEVARAALERLGPFGDRPEIRGAIEALVTRGLADECEPHLGWAAGRLEPTWAARLLAAARAVRGNA